MPVLLLPLLLLPCAYISNKHGSINGDGLAGGENENVADSADLLFFPALPACRCIAAALYIAALCG